jgi:hypothetical protein
VDALRQGRRDLAGYCGARPGQAGPDWARYAWDRRGTAGKAGHDEAGPDKKASTTI